MMLSDRQTPLVIGYGNRLRGDDGVGVVVAEALMKRAKRLDVRVIAAHQLTPELAELLSQASLAVFVDATVEAPLGHVRSHRLRPQGPGRHPFNHQLAPAELLFYAKTIYASAPCSWMISVGGQSWEREELSPAVQAAVPKVLRKVRLLVNGYRKSTVKPPSMQEA